MSYVVLARRYRPLDFNQIIGQDHISVTLKNAILKERVSHAYLFSGPRGTGKTSSARVLAKALRCLSPLEDGNPCNSCVSCAQINKGVSLDVIEIDAASNNGVENIRDLKENVQFAASVGHYRVYIIDEVHMLSTAAFNALLKTLEEPPKHVVFILATTELHKVPVTVQSRCQKFDFKNLSPILVTENIYKICKKESITIDEASVATIVLESEGCLRDAQSLLDRSIALCGKDINIDHLTEALGLMDRTAFFNLMKAISEGNTQDSLNTIVTLLDRGVDGKILLNRLIDFIRKLHHYVFTQSFPFADIQMQECAKQIATQIQPRSVINAMDLAVKTQSSLNSATNNSLVLEALIVKLATLFKNIDEAPVVSSPVKTSSKEPALTPVTKLASVKIQPRIIKQKASMEEPPPPESEMEIFQSEDFSSQINNGAENPIVQKIKEYILNHKPAWTPAIGSILEAKKIDSKLTIDVKNDFAGKRLASDDGKKILGIIFSDVSINVNLSEQIGANKKTKSTSEKRKEVEQGQEVQSVLKMFKGSKISETKILD